MYIFSKLPRNLFNDYPTFDQEGSYYVVDFLISQENPFMIYRRKLIFQNH